MAEQSEEVVGLVECLVRPLVDFEDDLNITCSEGDDGSIMVEIHVNEQDAGRVIGRRGRVIKSVRTLARACASRTDARVEVEIAE